MTDIKLKCEGTLQWKWSSFFSY